MIRSRIHAFTMIELLVVISIIAILVGILLPAINLARNAAKVSLNLGNFRQIGMGLALYVGDNKNYYFPHEANLYSDGSFADTFAPPVNPPNYNNFSDLAELNDLVNNHPEQLAGFAQGIQLTAANLAKDQTNGRRGAHWVDFIYAYMPNGKIFTSPMIDPAMLKQLNLNIVIPGAYGRYKWGGYGYNAQFLGYESTAVYPAYRARQDTDILRPSDTIAVGDSAGTQKTSTSSPLPGGNSYIMDPPYPSTNIGALVNRSDRAGKYYRDNGTASTTTPLGGVTTTAMDLAFNSTPGSLNWQIRVYPAPRNNGVPGFVFADGHAATKPLSQIDDFNGDGVLDNGYWNGRGDATSSGW